MIPDKKTVHRGLALGCVLLFAIASSVYLAMAVSPAAVAEEMPMLALAINVAPAVGYLYAALLLWGMFGTTLSGTVAIMEYLRLKFPASRKYRIPIIAAMGLAAFAGSGLGFSYLIGVLYSIFGYLGMGAMLLLLIHYLRVSLPRRQESATD